MEENKTYTEKYLEKHGLLATNASVWDLKAPYMTLEDLYKEALKRDTTWEKLLNFKGYKKDVLL